MKELLEPVLKQLPSYLPHMGGLLLSPKTTIVHWVKEAKGDLSRPLIFVGLTIAIGFVLQLPQLGKGQEFMVHAASMGLFKIVALAIFAAIIHFLFRMVGGNASFTATFSAYLYLASPLYLAGLLIELASMGVLRAYDPALVLEARTDPFYFLAHPDVKRQFSADSPILAFVYELLKNGNIFLILAWFIACWGAFRQLHNVGRWRSSAVGIAVAISFVFYMLAMYFVLVGMVNLPRPPLL